MTRKEELEILIKHLKESIKCNAMNLCSYGDLYFEDLEINVTEYKKYMNEFKNIK